MLKTVKAHRRSGLLFRATALAFLSAAPLVAQQADTSVYRSRRSPAAAAAWSIIPGAGQVYVHQTLIGFTLMGLTIGSFAGMAMPRDTTGFDCSYNNVNGSSKCKPILGGWDKQRGYGYAGAALWTLSIVSAPILARDYNRRHNLSASIAPGPNGTTRLGLAVGF